MKRKHYTVYIAALAIYICLPMRLLWAQDTGLGGNLAELLSLLAKSHPALSAARHEQEIASSQAVVAGSLEDPEFDVRLEDINAPHGAPDRFGSVYYDLSQKFPLGSKREARRNLALVDVEKAKRGGILALADLQYTMKLAYARRYLALEAERLTKERVAILRDLSRLTQEQLSQGLGTQSEAVAAEIESTHLLDDLVKAESEQRKSASSINILLGRPADAILADPKELPVLPSAENLNLKQLIELASTASPDLGLPQADILSAEKEKAVAASNWWPDLTVRGTKVEGYGRNGYPDGYEAQIGVNLPLQWEMREAAEHAAISKLAAARDKQEEIRRLVAEKCQDAYWGLIAANKREKILREQLLPQMQSAIAVARNAYGTGQGSFNEVLQALNELKLAEQEHLAIRLEQQQMLASIERLIGAPL